MFFEMGETAVSDFGLVCGWIGFPVFLLVLEHVVYDAGKFSGGGCGRLGWTEMGLLAPVKVSQAAFASREC